MTRRRGRPGSPAGRREPVAASWQLAVMGAAGFTAGIVLAVLNDPVIGPLLGWDVAALIYLVWVWRIIWPMDAAETARLAVREDPNRALRDVLLLAACLASLLATGVVLTTAHAAHGVYRNLDIALGTVSVVLSWTVVHTVFTTRYARIYYTGPDGGVDFNQREPPRYSDFAYLAFTVGATFQVSDTALTCNEMRTTVLRHLLLSYLFGAIIIAATVNLLAGLAR
ncbi:DUF1345 domain-containing protein [Micromonospora echinofusca]|nr:DUF1345 domain-containing protein [Micromonospora echinofusca]